MRSLSSSSALDAVIRNLLLVRPGNCPPPRKDTNLHVKVKFRHRLATKERSPTIPVLREGGCHVRRPRNRRWDLSHLKLRWELRAGRVQPVPDQRREAAAVPYRIEGAFPQTLEAVKKVVDPASLSYISWSHLESDECGALNEFLGVAPK